MKPKEIVKAPPSPATSKTAALTDWDDVADWYDQHVGESGSEFHREIVLPGTLRLLALKPGEKAVDIACGQGVLCRLLASKGIEATGVDSSANLIRSAKERSAAPAELPAGAVKPPVPAYHIADARELEFLPENLFNAAACVLAIQNIHPIGSVFSGVARSLASGGRFVLVMMHPCFRGPKETQWGWDDANKVQYRRVDRYLLPRKSPIVTHPGKDPGKYTWSFHKPIESYVKAMRNAGLLIDAMEEWASHKKSTSGPKAGAENVAREEIPMFLAIRGVKVSGHSLMPS